MTNEWNEYKAYIDQPIYTVSNGKDTTFLGRFTTEMIKDFKGFARIFTILARGYLFHNADGSLKDGDPRERIEHVFAFMTVSMRGLTVRSIGIERAAFNIGLTNFVYNLCRYSFLSRKEAAVG